MLETAQGLQHHWVTSDSKVPVCEQSPQPVWTLCEPTRCGEAQDASPELALAIGLVGAMLPIQTSSGTPADTASGHRLRRNQNCPISAPCAGSPCLAVTKRSRKVFASCRNTWLSLPSSLLHIPDCAWRLCVYSITSKADAAHLQQFQI